jgi:hypothetical protein
MNASPTPLRIWIDGAEQPLRPAGRITIGRTPENDISIVHPMVSRHHLVIEWRGGHWTVVDVGSTNGFYADGMRVPSMILHGNHRIRLGDSAVGPVVDITAVPPAWGHPGSAQQHSAPIPRSIPGPGRAAAAGVSGALAAPHLQALHQNVSAVYQIGADGQISPQAGPGHRDRLQGQGPVEHRPHPRQRHRCQ